MRENIVFLVNKSEIAAGTRGASLGPEAIITAARKVGSTMFSQNKVQLTVDFNHLLDTPTPFHYAKCIDGALEVYKGLNKEVSRILNNNEFPFILAGDHGSSAGTIAGIKTAFPSKRLGVVWIDAHADIHTPYTTPSGNIHGMPLAASFAIDNKECQSNDVDELTATLWNQLKNIGNISPKINPEDLIYVGVRSTEAQEDAIIKRLGIRNIPVSEIHDLGIDQITASIENHLQHCDMIYVSFDVDSMDPNLISNGTGTPVQNGLTPSEATTLLVALMQNPKTICMEVVEVNPCLDNKGNAMAEAAFAIIDTIVTTIKV